MCGLVGYGCSESFRGVSPSSTSLIKAIDTLAHRGPDATGSWLDTGVGMGHARLAIRDLSEHGAQPMESNSGRFVIVYNGEIYDLDPIRKRLASHGYTLKGNSDTEVLLGSIEVLGIEETLRTIDGMFAFAVFDRELKSTYLARDRSGEKPLYYSSNLGILMYASELTALTELLHEPPSIDHSSLAAFLRHNYVPGPFSIYQNIFKLQPAHFAVFDSTGSLEVNKYWNYADYLYPKNNQTDGIASSEVISRTNDLLVKATVRRLESDVPVGAFLSGGIDSSLVTAIMQQHSKRPVKTFSAGFEDPRFDEQGYARDIAKYLGTDHSAFTFTEQDAVDIVPEIAGIYDEPFADSSQLPTIMISRVTREQVTVVLTGDGGDELFTGYSRYLMLNRAQGGSLRYLGATAPTARAVSKIVPRRYLEHLASWIPGVNNPSKALNTLLAWDSSGSPSEPLDFYRSMVSHWLEPEILIGSKSENVNETWLTTNSNNFANVAQMARVVDFSTYLPDDILVKVDRATMSVGLEARTPFLDREVMEWSAGLSPEFTVRGSEMKWVLKQVLGTYLPPSLFERPKMGFGVPLADWLRGPLHEWANDLLSHNFLKNQGIFESDPIQSKWQAHINGEDWAYPLWNILMFQSWLAQRNATTR